MVHWKIVGTHGISTGDYRQPHIYIYIVYIVIYHVCIYIYTFYTYTNVISTYICYVYIGYTHAIHITTFPPSHVARDAAFSGARNSASPWVDIVVAWWTLRDAWDIHMYIYIYICIYIYYIYIYICNCMHLYIQSCITFKKHTQTWTCSQQSHVFFSFYTRKKITSNMVKPTISHPIDQPWLGHFSSSQTEVYVRLWSYINRCFLISIRPYPMIFGFNYHV